MHTSHKKEEPLVDLGYEIRDIDYKGLGKVTLFFLAFVAFSFGSVGIWFALAQPKLYSTLDPRKPMPEIPLQSNIDVRADIQEFRQNETKILTQPGTNPDGSQRIPIDRAMDIIAARGLASKTTSVPAVSPHNTIKINSLAPGEQAPAGNPTGQIPAMGTQTPGGSAP